MRTSFHIRSFSVANVRLGSSRTLVFTLWGIALSLIFGATVTNVEAQGRDTTVVPGVSLGLVYRMGSKPGVIVLPSTTTGSDSIRAILQRDLDYDDRSTVIPSTDADARAYLPKGGKVYNYKLFEQLGAALVVHPRVTPKGLSVTLLDVGAQKEMRSQLFKVPGKPNSSEWRFALHTVSDQIGLWIFGQPGAAATRILYSLNGNIWIIDSDGANERKVTSGMLDLSPQWHPNGAMFVYSGYSGQGTGSQIGIRNLQTGETHWKTSSPRGLNITPTFSPNGKTLVYAHGVEANTDIVSTSLEDNRPHRRLTVRGGVNTSPTFSPDGRRVAYMSGRVGHPEVYIMDADGTNGQLLTEFTYGERSYRASPDWSPDGRLVAYMSQLPGGFQIMTIDVRDRSTKQYTSDGVNEDPSWAPNSRHLVFSSTRSGARQLWVLDVVSGRLRQLTRQPGAKLPAWSPRLKGP